MKPARTLACSDGSGAFAARPGGARAGAGPGAMMHPSQSTRRSAARVARPQNRLCGSTSLPCCIQISPGTRPAGVARRALKSCTRRSSVAGADGAAFAGSGPVRGRTHRLHERRGGAAVAASIVALRQNLRAAHVALSARQTAAGAYADVSRGCPPSEDPGLAVGHGMFWTPHARRRGGAGAARVGAAVLRVRSSGAAGAAR